MPSDNVVVLDVVTRLGLPPGRIIDGVLSNNVKEIMVIGWDDKDEFYFASNFADGGDALWLLEKAKKALLEV